MLSSEELTSPMILASTPGGNLGRAEWRSSMLVAHD